MTASNRNPPASSANALATMRANRRVSQRELAFRRAIWHEGVRGYRVQTSLPGRPDLAFPKLRVAVFVNGCFWHKCGVCTPPEPRSHKAFWRSKLQQNVQRDVRNLQALREHGWDVVTVWEHEIRHDPSPRAKVLAHDIARRRLQPGPG